jgi:hypothetical protein
MLLTGATAAATGIGSAVTATADTLAAGSGVTGCVTDGVTGVVTGAGTPDTADTADSAGAITGAAVAAAK